MSKEIIEKTRIENEKLRELLIDIALIAHGHKKAELKIDGENVALVAIRNNILVSLGMGECLKEDGSLSFSVGEPS